ncbi:DUF2569 domain-containing protein [Citrobacter rodentium]|uniref:Membrane protein n=2 Tax=Citrobacter rodentium TaxID=67825 RepID=D2TK55_CITRI|nr:DUF2569 domain-containing protein [Citrobacter rodentium]KIQ52740.1 hypothetical protein TA05_03165 [Citrobacter rodentium]QBY31631.1 DUF2569 domain-containing protein [Citrobacter rodentium]UHO31011.1 DUF2569 domain-containing protein [Citrobacter rodentium NBRC 105723 = DSM 16636]CBG87185.1 putative membrane protein [Citrobacter rodentium ICC168]HAT8015498.1 DUF2569 domain-containing protein [Citrobacter rodentium NBRC 105723 = DSM 16636]
MKWGCIKCGVEIPQHTEYCSECEDKQFTKIGGFLYLPLLGLFITALSHLVASYESFKYLVDNFYHLFFDAKLFFIGTFTISLVVFLAAAWVISVFLRKKKSLPKLYIGLMLLLIVLTALNTWMLSVLIPGIYIGSEELVPLLRLIISACIWIPYFLKSVRVKRTFINP